MNLTEAKASLRKSQLAALREIPIPQRAGWSALIVTRLCALPCWSQAQSVMMYAPMVNEPDLLPLLESGKRMIFPKVTPLGLTLHVVTAVDQLVSSTNRLREPNVAQCPEVSLAEVDLVVIPGLAFDRQNGIRLGRGGGYYDRLLSHASFRARPVGVCFQCQVMDSLPREAHDLAVEKIVTEQETTSLMRVSAFGR